MLLEFTVRNFLSIKDGITLSGLASKATIFEDNIIEYTEAYRKK